MSPQAIDLFGDADLQAHCRALQAMNYPGDLLKLASTMPPGPWMYTGALENYPALIDCLAKVRPLWGNAGAAVRRVRDPEQWSAALRRAGLSVPRVMPAAASVPADGSWLRKRLRSAGGQHVRVWKGLPEADPRHTSKVAKADDRYYFQERVEGTPIGAVYCAAASDTQLLGVSEQLIGQRWCGARGFQYCGSVGPRILPAAATSQLQAVGACLQQEFGLLGLFGVDAIWDGKTLWPVEINPRYTASVEILERSLGICAMAHHATAFGGTDLAMPSTTIARGGEPICGKAIWFASRDIVISESLFHQLWEQTSGCEPRVADVPKAGSQISRGRPVISLFARGRDRNSVVELLREAIGYWERLAS